MNWRRGLKRLLVIGCVGWAFTVLVYWPLEQIKSSTDFAFSFYTSEYFPNDWEKQRDQALERATWGYVYNGMWAEMKQEPWLAPLIIAVPFVIYGLIYGAIWVCIWLFQGFRRSA